MPDLCAVCSKVLSKWNLETYPGLDSGSPTFGFGRVNEIQARKECALCQLLLSLVPLHDATPIDASDTLAGQIKNFSHRAGDDDPCDLDIYLNGIVKTMMMEGLRLGSLKTKQLWQEASVESSISSVIVEIRHC